MTLHDFALINRAFLTYSILLAVVLIAAMTRRNPSRKRRLLLDTLWVHLISLSARFVAWCSVRTPGAAAHAGLAFGTSIADIFAILTCLGIMLYVYSDVSGVLLDGVHTDPVIITILLCNGINLLLVLTNPWTHFYYSFDEGNNFVLGRFLLVRNLLFFVQGVMMVPTVMRLRKRNGMSRTIQLLCCAAIAVVSSLVEFAIPGISLLFPNASLMLAILAIGVQGHLEEELSAARADAAESRVRLLSGQIHPHFIFNSLAAIDGLIAEDPECAGETVRDFSDYLRSHLDVMSDTKLVPFQDELAHVRHYVALEKADYVLPLEVTYDLGVVDFLVPPLTVQPLVENAIRHGIRTREEGGTVLVSTCQTDGGVEVRVQDDGRGFSSATTQQEKRRRVGIENVRERIERQCGGTLTVQSNAQGTVATLTIPGEGAL